MKNEKIILHIDMDAFYASIEQRDNPKLKGLPVVVGGPPDSRSVVSTCSYEARSYGIRTAMPCREAKKLCPHAVFVNPHFNKYKEASKMIHKIFSQYTPLVEGLALDEAFLDVTGSMRLFESPQKIGLEIKEKILEHVGITCSVGIAATKYFAKIGSTLFKPDGLFTITDEWVKIKYPELPVNKIWGVGKKSSQRLNQCGIFTIADVQRIPFEFLNQKFGIKAAAQIKSLVSGQDERIVSPINTIKSIGRSETFASDISELEILKYHIRYLVHDVAKRLRKKKLYCKTIAVKIRYYNFKDITRQISLQRGTNSEIGIREQAWKLIKDNWNQKPVRLLGVTAYQLTNIKNIENTFFTNQLDIEERYAKIDKVFDKIEKKFGKDLKYIG